MITVGIAGLGRSGWNIHIHGLSELTDKFKILAVTDPLEDRLKEAEEKLGCKTYKTFDELINDKDINLVVVATPSHLHCEHTVKALKSGKNVVCEKPMARSVEEADSMIKAAKETGKILTIFQNWRYNPSFLKVKEIIDSGKLGRIVEIKITSHSFTRRWDWQTLKKFGGGTLNNWGAHLIDVALLLLGDMDFDIFCYLDRTLTLGDADDHCKVILKPKTGGPLIDIELTSACAYPQKLWLVMGTQGSLEGTHNEIKWKWYDPKNLPERKLQTEPTPDRSYNRDEIPWEEEQIWKLPEKTISPVASFYKELYTSLIQGTSPPITPESVRKQIYVLEQCRKLSPI